MLSQHWPACHQCSHRCGSSAHPAPGPARQKPKVCHPAKFLLIVERRAYVQSFAYALHVQLSYGVKLAWRKDVQDSGFNEPKKGILSGFEAYHVRQLLEDAAELVDGALHALHGRGAAGQVCVRPRHHLLLLLQQRLPAGARRHSAAPFVLV